MINASSGGWPKSTTGLWPRINTLQCLFPLTSSGFTGSAIMVRYCPHPPDPQAHNMMIPITKYKLESLILREVKLMLLHVRLISHHCFELSHKPWLDCANSLFQKFSENENHFSQTAILQQAQMVSTSFFLLPPTTLSWWTHTYYIRWKLPSQTFGSLMITNGYYWSLPQLHICISEECFGPIANVLKDP